MPKGKRTKNISKSEPSSKKIYSISIMFGKDIFSGAGATALEALESTPRPVKIVSKGLIEMTDGTRTVVRMWQPAEIKRMFYPNAQRLFAKRLLYLMK